MKHRILVVGHYLEIGGAETSLIGLLNALDYSKVDVDLFLYRHTGELMDMIPEQVNLLPEIPAYSFIERSIKDTLLHGKVLIALARIFAKVRFALYSRKAKPISVDPYYGYLERTMKHVLPSLKKYGEYDLALNFIGMPCVVLEKTNAKVKAGWIHTDYSTISVNQHKEEPRWLLFDHIVSISDAVTDTFVKTFPHTESKIFLMENILSPVLVRERSQEFSVAHEMPHKPGCTNILSIGRFCVPKRFEAIPKMLSIMRKKGIAVHWYLIGYGDETLIRQETERYQVGNMLTILGKKSNPYPYIKACDIYAQPSIYEGKSVTVREAQILCKPVAITNYATAQSQVKNGVDGVIVPLDVESCANGLIDLIKDIELQKGLSLYLQSHDYGNEAEAKKVYRMLGL